MDEAGGTSVGEVSAGFVASGIPRARSTAHLGSQRVKKRQRAAVAGILP